LFHIILCILIIYKTVKTVVYLWRPKQHGEVQIKNVWTSDAGIDEVTVAAVYSHIIILTIIYIILISTYISNNLEISCFIIIGGI